MNGDYYDNIYALLEYLYTYDYKVVLSGEERGPVPELRFHVKIYATADRYDVPKLKNLARTKFGQTLENARIHDVQDGLYKVLKDVYTTTPETDRGLRDHVLQFCASHNEIVLGKRNFVKTADRLPGFWKEVCRNMLEVVNEDPKFYCCTNCGYTEECCSACEPFCGSCGRVFSTADVVADSDVDSDSSLEGTIKASSVSRNGSQPRSADEQVAQTRDIPSRGQDMAHPSASAITHEELTRRRHSVGVFTSREPRSQPLLEGAFRKRKLNETVTDNRDGGSAPRWSVSPTNKRKQT